MDTLVQDLRYALRQLGIFAATALLLAGIGIYGVISYGVTQHTRDLGIRMALGAGAERVQRMILAQGMAPVLGGIALGWRWPSWQAWSPRGGPRGRIR